MNQPLLGQTILVTGAARRLGKLFALTCALAGADVVIHHGHSADQAEDARQEIAALGRRAWVVQAELSDPAQTGGLMPQINAFTPLHGLINSAAIFESLSQENTSLAAWEKHMAINLTAPFLLSQAFARQAPEGSRIVNILDWRALRPGADHFPYTISKAALAAMTRSLAIALAPKLLVNGLALGAILPPADGNTNPDILTHVPAQRWARKDEVEAALLWTLTAPSYITGEIIHLDGGRHLL